MKPHYNYLLIYISSKALWISPQTIIFQIYAFYVESKNVSYLVTKEIKDEYTTKDIADEKIVLNLQDP